MEAFVGESRENKMTNILEMERRERGGVLVGRVMMSQQKLQQEENTEMVQHFFLNFGLPRAEGEW